MTDQERITKAQEKMNQVDRSYTPHQLSQVRNWLREGIRLLAPVRDKEGQDLQAKMLSTLINLGLIGGDFEDIVEPLHALRRLVTQGDQPDLRGRLDQFTAEAIPLLLELPGFTRRDMEALIAPIYERNKDDAERRRMMDVFLLESYQKLGMETEARKVAAALRTSRETVFRIECPGCQDGLQVVVYVLLGDLEEALAIAEPLFDGTVSPCLRSPRVPAAVLLNHYLRAEDLESAERYAHILEERIDYPLDGGIKLVNPLLEYYVRTGDYLEALEWVNCFGQRMVRSPFLRQRARFFQSFAQLLSGLKGEGWTHMEARDLRFSVPVTMIDQGYPIEELAEWMTILCAVPNCKE